MIDACSRWIELTDREAVGEALAAEEATFVRDHVASCADCRAEAEVFAGMRALVEVEAERPPTKTGPETRIESETKASGPVRRPWILASAIAAAAIAAAAIAVVGPKMSAGTKPPMAQMPVAAAPAARVVVSVTSGGAIEIDGRLGAVGQELAQGSVLFARDGTACVEVGPSVRACLAKGSLVRVADTSASLRLELLGGKIVAELDPLPKGTSFGVVSREGASIAVGTAFSVEVPPGDSAVVTRVLHGTVAVRARDGATRHVAAHEKIATGSSGGLPTALPSSEETHEESLLVSAPASRAAGATPVNVESDAPGATVTIDDRVVGQAPLAILLAQGDHVISVAAPAQPAVRHSLHVSGAAPIARRFETPAPVVASSTPSAAPPVPAKSSASLLANARERRARGDLEGATAAYRELFAEHGASIEAHTALVPYGELQLAQLGDPSGALASFDRYLVSGGPLDEEASFGRIRALRALGRTEDARAAAESFVRRFPESPLATPLREREESRDKDR